MSCDLLNGQQIGYSMVTNQTEFMDGCCAGIRYKIYIELLYVNFRDGRDLVQHDPRQTGPSKLIWGNITAGKSGKRKQCSFADQSTSTSVSS